MKMKMKMTNRVKIQTRLKTGRYQ